MRPASLLVIALLAIGSVVTLVAAIAFTRPAEGQPLGPAVLVRNGSAPTYATSTPVAPATDGRGRLSPGAAATTNPSPAAQSGAAASSRLQQQVETVPPPKAADLASLPFDDDDGEPEEDIEPGTDDYPEGGLEAIPGE